MEKILKIFLLTLLWLSPVNSHAATINFSSNSNFYEVGTTFVVNVNVSSPDKNLNAVSGTISFPGDKLEVLSVSKSGSILNFWVEEPSYSNAQDFIKFEGVVLNPGFIGLTGKVVSITFKAKSPGQVLLNFPSSSVLANDGLGTNILTSALNLSLNIKEAIPKIEKKEMTESEDNKNIKTTEIGEPVIVDYPRGMYTEDILKIVGRADVNSIVNVYLKDSKNIITEESAVSNDSGDFVLIWSKKLQPGLYSFYAETQLDGLKSTLTEEYNFEVKENIVQKDNYRLNNYLLFVIILVLIAFLILGLFVYLILHSHIRGDRSKRLNHRRDKQDLDSLRNTLIDHFYLFEKVKNKKQLTKEEDIFVDIFREYITKIEQNINNNDDN